VAVVMRIEGLNVNGFTELLQLREGFVESQIIAWFFGMGFHNGMFWDRKAQVTEESVTS